MLPKRDRLSGSILVSKVVPFSPEQYVCYTNGYIRLSEPESTKHCIHVTPVCSNTRDFYMGLHTRIEMEKTT